MRTGIGQIILAVLAPLILALAASAVGATQPDGDAEIARLINATNNPLPIVPIVVPLLRSRGEVHEMLAPGRLPTLFQISQPRGQNADSAKVRFFEMLAVEYPLKVNFRRVAAGSPAAWRLYHAVTKPVYVLCDPNKEEEDRCAFIDEALMPEGGDVKQTTIEGFIYNRLGIIPTVLTTFPLTAANVQSIVFEYQPGFPNPQPTARWIVVLFLPNGDKLPGPINRLRVLVALERFFYANRLRIAECDLSTASEVYKALVSDATATPTEPELWLINPGKRQGVNYASEGAAAPLADLTHAAFEAWLEKNGVAPPPADAALNAEAAWQELARLERQAKKH